MENELYTTIIVPSHSAADGETPTKVVLTRECNGFVVWFDDYNTTEIVKWFKGYEKDKALEFTVDYGRNMLRAYQKSLTDGSKFPPVKDSAAQSQASQTNG